MVTLTSKDWQLSDVETILFDKDGTLTNSHIYWGRIIVLRAKAVMKHYNLKDEVFEQLCLSLGYDCQKQRLIPEGPVAILSREEVINSLIKKLSELKIIATEADIGEIFKAVHAQFLPEIKKYTKVIDGVEDFLKKLASHNVKLAVVTSDIRKNTETVLEYLNLRKYFDVVIGKDDCKQAKKTGEPALVALNLLGIKKEKAIALGDAFMDYEMAKNSGLRGTVLVTTGQNTFQELKEYTPTVINSLREIDVYDD